MCVQAGYSNSLNLSFGIVNLSPTINASSLTNTDTGTEAQATTTESAKPVSVLCVDAKYEFFPTQKRTYFIAGHVPVFSADGAGVYLMSGGVNWYLSDLSSLYSYEKDGSTITIVPAFKYYWGVSTGLGYLIYNTDSAKKSDLFFDLGVHGGGAYALSEERSLTAELGLSRSTGVGTTGFKMNLFFGVVQYL